MSAVMDGVQRDIGRPRRSLLWRFCLVVVLTLVAMRVSATDVPGDSVYRLTMPLRDQDGREFHLADHQGKPVLISMFYTSCKFVCPLIIDTLTATQRAVGPEARGNLHVVLVSFDPERDSTARLKSVFDQRHLDAADWTLARTETANVRKLGAALDIQYRALANREINHTTALVLLDAQGRIVARSDKLGASDPELVAAIRRTLGSAGQLPSPR